MNFKKIISYAMSFLLVISLGACSSTENLNNNENKTANREPVIISTSVAVTEILDSLDIKLKGVPTTIYNLPEGTKDAVKVGSPMNPDLEIIKSLNPTVVVSVDTLGDDFKNIFIENNIPSEFVTLTSLNGLKETIDKLGNKFNKKDEADKILSTIVSKENEIIKAHKGEEKPKVLIVFSAPGSLMIGTDKCYLGSLIDAIGAENLIKNNKSPFVPINMEEIVKLNPDKVLVMTHGDPETSKVMAKNELTTNPMWQRVIAVKNNKVEYLDSEYFGMSANLKVNNALDMLDKTLYNN
ncbi:heme ABC transporter substrate-binding protein IsdE [Clostridium tarantellae]|uniref:High-affinity heme uptake system protein IsdE n=1 Tax=Clostridium tarantellae TaxID=39493 RepID=A0A6I1MP75_9CLOT|nr:heme ABC transporter substrate-binding protein IsdE [Clostridium tarantellae]MPQ44278.1 heme ABC transporter substrate-binding protein IsdE [Clostridium tarantellae]